MTTENIQTSPQSQTITAIEPDQLVLQIRRIRRARPKLDLNQLKIAKKLGCTQSAISHAISKPDIYPGLAARIGKYLNSLESSQNKSTTPETSIHA